MSEDMFEEEMKMQLENSGYEQNPYAQWESAEQNPYAQAGSTAQEPNPYMASRNNPYSSGRYDKKSKKSGTGFGIASLVLGIVALLTLYWTVNLPFAILSIISGIIQIVFYEKKGMAFAGIILSGLSLVLLVGAYIFFLYLIWKIC